MQHEENIKREWDIYWTAQGTSTSYLYNFFANFYRNKIIKRYLNHFLKKHFKEGQKVLHAGCGSGKVDTDMVNYLTITALDISPSALAIYNKVNEDRAKTVLGNIFALPFENETFSGIYNLGVMEHFTSQEIIQILLEFKRTLKPNGKIVLFIPPVFGLTVQVLDTAHFVLNKIFRKKIKLHPDEITRVRSQKHIRELVEKAGFKFIEYYFGSKDLFTQVVVVAEKV